MSRGARRRRGTVWARRGGRASWSRGFVGTGASRHAVAGLICRLILPIALLVAPVILVPAEGRLVLNSDDSPETCRAKVTELAQCIFSPPGLDGADAEAFLNELRTVDVHTQSAYAGAIARYVEDTEEVSYLNRVEAAQLVAAFRWLYQVSAVQDQAMTELCRVIADYDGRMEQIRTHLASTRTEFEHLREINAASEEIIADAMDRVRTSQDSVEVLAGVMETYRAIIADQREIIEGELGVGGADGGAVPGWARAGANGSRPADVSIFAGPNWYYGESADLSEYTLLAGTRVSWPILRRTRFGLGFLTTFPPSNAGMFVEVGW